MPSTWRMTPEELHRSYLANTNAFYKASGSAAFAPEVDELLRSLAAGLWSRSAGVSEENVRFYNQLYSKGQKPPETLHWELTAAVCAWRGFTPPPFFRAAAASDAKRGAGSARLLTRVVTNVLLTLAATDDEVSQREADFIAQVTRALDKVCDDMGVKPARGGIDPLKQVTSPLGSFLDQPLPEPPAAKPGEAQPEEPQPEEPLPTQEELLAELDSLIGLDRIKTDVRSLINLIKVRKLREAHGLKTPPLSLHMVFMGNPGTGKTTVARLLAGLYRSIGVLSKGQLVETDRSGLVAGFVGQTAIKAKEAVERAAGGVLFIDEAYALAGEGNDFGHEAVEVILKNMEDRRHDLVVIAAGYEGPMEKFIASNPGLESRFGKYFMFEDYNGEQLFDIFMSLCKKNQYEPDEAARAAARERFKAMYDERDENFGNARDVRNVFERAVARQSDRVAALAEAGERELMELTAEDIQGA